MELEGIDWYGFIRLKGITWRHYGYCSSSCHEEWWRGDLWCRWSKSILLSERAAARHPAWSSLITLIIVLEARVSPFLPSITSSGWMGSIWLEFRFVAVCIYQSFVLYLCSFTEEAFCNYGVTLTESRDDITIYLFHCLWYAEDSDSSGVKFKAIYHCRKRDFKEYAQVTATPVQDGWLWVWVQP